MGDTPVEEKNAQYPGGEGPQELLEKVLEFATMLAGKPVRRASLCIVVDVNPEVSEETNGMHFLALEAGETTANKQSIELATLNGGSRALYEKFAENASGGDQNAARSIRQKIRKRANEFQP